MKYKKAIGYSEMSHSVLYELEDNIFGWVDDRDDYIEIMWTWYRLGGYIPDFTISDDIPAELLKGTDKVIKAADENRFKEDIEREKEYFAREDRNRIKAIREAEARVSGILQ